MTLSEGYWTYVRTDRNGTKHYISHKCPRCAGLGYLPGFECIDGGRCFKCGGTGQAKCTYHFQEYTPEYKKVLDEKKRVKELQKAPTRNRAQMIKDGFSEDGRVWIVLGNSYNIREELREAGAKYDNIFGWHFDHEVTDYPCAEILYTDVTTEATNGYLFLDIPTAIRRVDELKEAYAAQRAAQSVSEYFGKIGERQLLKLTYNGRSSYETHLTFRGETHWVLKFTDAAGNKFIWNTTSWSFPALKEGQMYIIRATIKDHSEYKGEKQTALARVKFEGMEDLEDAG